MDELTSPRPFSLRDHWLLLPILVIVTLLRLWQINESLWLDELHSAWVVSAGAGDVAERAQIGNQSPLYFYLLWATTSLFGMSEWALRLPSLVAGVGLVAMAYGLAYQFTRSRIAAAACSLLAALDDNFLFYATEARPYAWVQLIAAGQLCMFWKLQAATTARRRIAFIAFTVLLFYLHYTAILLVAGEVAFLLARSICCRPSQVARVYRVSQIAVDLLCVAAMMMPMAVHLSSIGSRRGAWASFINNTSLLLPVNWFSLGSYVVAPVIVCLVVGLIKVAITLRRDEPISLESILGVTSDRDSNASTLGSSRRSVTATFGVACLLLCWLGAPLATVWLLTVAEVAPLYLGRYVIGAALAPVLFAGLCIGVWNSRRLQMIVAGVLIAYAVYAGGMIEQFQVDGRLFRDRAENWRDAVSYVNDNRVLDVPVLVRSGLLEADRLATDESELLREYCVLPVTSIYRIEGPTSRIRPLTTRDAGKLTNEDVKQIEATGSAWFIINGGAATRERSAQRVVDSVARQLPSATTPQTLGAAGLAEKQFGQVGVFHIVIFTIAD